MINNELRIIIDQIKFYEVQVSSCDRAIEILEKDIAEDKKSDEMFVNEYLKKNFDEIDPKYGTYISGENKYVGANTKRHIREKRYWNRLRDKHKSEIEKLTSTASLNGYDIKSIHRYAIVNYDPQSCQVYMDVIRARSEDEAKNEFWNFGRRYNILSVVLVPEENDNTY